MNFNAPLLRPIRILLFPLSLVYALIVWVRNKFFDMGILSSSSFNLPVIGVGNLSAGGTGKSPMVEFLIAGLRQNFQVAVLSRGYKRKTRGYALANDHTTALDIGDEPLQFHMKFPDITVAVGEERIVAIPQLLHDKPSTQVIILDDAFQHRYVTPGLNILLTDCNNLFTRDWFLPTGDLRDMKGSYVRADIIVVTKCNPGMPAYEQERIKKEIRPLPHQHLFFTAIQYGSPFHIVNGDNRHLDDQTEVLLVTGIANPRPLKKYIADHSVSYTEILYGDHHIFSIDDWKEIRTRFEGMPSSKKIIVTTEKDATRLIKFGRALEAYPIYVIPIEVRFLNHAAPVFNELISKFISGFRHKNIHTDVKEKTV